MNSLIENGTLKYVESGACFAYVLSDNSLFLPTEYKVLQSQNSSFVKCMKMMFNGETMLYYLPGTTKPLNTMLKKIDGNSFVKIVVNLFTEINKVNDNGFLTCQNIDGELSRIYVDQTTCSVYLVYMPVSRRNYEDFFCFEKEIRNALLNAISENENLKCVETSALEKNLSDELLSIEDILSELGGIQRGDTCRDGMKNTLRLVAVNAPVHQAVEVTKKEFFIGKHPDLVDGVISFNKMISRRHCKVIYQEGEYSMVDLNSSNHTYVNGKRLVPNVPCKLENGAMVRLADSDFRVEIM